MEIVLSAWHIGMVSREIGRLRHVGREAEAAAVEAELNDLIRRADNVSLGITIGALNEIVRHLNPDAS